MSQLAVIGIVAALVLTIVISEVVCALLPLLVVVTLVPASERKGVAEVLAATNRSPRVRLWPALHAAVTARRRRERYQRSGSAAM